MPAAAAKLKSEPAPAKLKPNERAQLYAEHLVMLALGKYCYKRADALLEVVLLQSNRYEPTPKITRRRLGKKAMAATLRNALNLLTAMVEGRRFTVADKFANRNSVPVGQNARRFEIEEFTA
jgi:hypothetical protein